MKKIKCLLSRKEVGLLCLLVSNFGLSMSYLDEKIDVESLEKLSNYLMEKFECSVCQ